MRTARTKRDASMDDGHCGRIFPAQAFAGMTLADAAAEAETYPSVY